MQSRNIKNIIYPSIIFITLTGSIFIAYSAEIRDAERGTRFDMIVGKIDNPNFEFQITKLAFGGEGYQNDYSTASRSLDPAEYRFTFSHIIIEKEIDYFLVSTLLNNIMEGRDLEFELIITVYQNCVTTITQCTVSSRLTFPNAFIAGYTSIHNDLSQTAGTGFVAYDLFEFGFTNVLIENPETIEDIPYIPPSGVSQRESSSGDRDIILNQNTDWKINFISIPEFQFYALQFSITAIISYADPLENSRTHPVGYTFSDIYLEKDPLDSITTQLLDAANNAYLFDVFISIGYCDRAEICENELLINLYGTYITSVYTFLDDPYRNDDKMQAVEIFSLASVGFQYILQ